MRYLLLLLLAVVAALYFTLGLRVGMLNLSPTYLFNATGSASYPYRAYSSAEKVTLSGTCNVSSGSATLRFVSPGGRALPGQACSSRGRYSLSLTAGGETGIYNLSVDYHKFTGQIKLTESRSGN